MLERSPDSNDQLNLNNRLSSSIAADEILFNREALSVLRTRSESSKNNQPSDGWLFVAEIGGQQSAEEGACDTGQKKNADSSTPTEKQDTSTNASETKEDPKKGEKVTTEEKKKESDPKAADKSDTVEIPVLLLGQEAREGTVKKYPKDSVIAKTYDKVAPSVVKIEATRPGAIKSTTETSFGTGFFVAENGVIATNDHVFNGFDEIKIRTADGKVYKAKVLAEDKVNDVALLKITPEEGTKYEPLQMEPDSKSIAMQQKVMVLGHAKGWDKTYLSEGEVVGATAVKKVEPKPNPPEENPDKRIVAIKAHGEDGGSGGPVVNENGKVTGLAELASDSAKGQHVFMTLVEPLNALIDKTLVKKK